MSRNSGSQSSWFVAPFPRLPTIAAPCSSIGFCNITAELFSKGLCSWPLGNRSVVPNGGRGLRLRNPVIKTFVLLYDHAPPVE